MLCNQISEKTQAKDNWFLIKIINMVNTCFWEMLHRKIELDEGSLWNLRNSIHSFSTHYLTDVIIGFLTPFQIVTSFDWSCTSYLFYLLSCWGSRVCLLSLTQSLVHLLELWLQGSVLPSQRLHMVRLRLQLTVGHAHILNNIWKFLHRTHINIFILLSQCFIWPPCPQHEMILTEYNFVMSFSILSFSMARDLIFLSNSGAESDRLGLATSNWTTIKINKIVYVHVHVCDDWSNLS